ncbi:unnamed protein product [Durusdinium trenchii]|uniref:Uncharacterized protein n=1 Tax=Durusdinium trenchii TaxID=1381693 RepID=A0ABP0SYD8_9DINO
MTVAIYHYVKPGKEAWKLFLLTLKARLFENMTSQASVPYTPESAASVVESLGDAALLTEEEVTSSQCCTCHKPIDKDNSLVIVRAGVKSSNEIRRCRPCHSMRSAIERGEDLRKRLEEIVQDWKISTTRYEFNQEADFVEESDLRAKYADKPEIAENILKNSLSFFCPIKKVILYADPKYQAKVSDQHELGHSEKRKGLDDTTDAKAPKRPKKADKNGKDGDPADEPKLKAGEKKKVAKKAEQVSSKVLQMKDTLEKCSSFGDMIPPYVIKAASDAKDKSQVAIQNAQTCLDSGKGDSSHLIETLDATLNELSEGLARVKNQLEQASKFK